MANFKFATTFLPFTVSLAAGSSEDAASPASNLALFQYPNRPHWTQDVTSEKVILDLGSAKVLKALLLVDANFTTALVRIADDIGITTNVQSIAGPTINRDRRVNRYQVWADYPSNAFARRYVEITYSGPLAGETAYRLGTVAAFDAVTTIAQNPGWQRLHREEPTARLQFEGGAEDANDSGPTFLVYDFGQSSWKTVTGVEAHLQDILDVGTAGYFAMWENNGDTSKAYIFRRLGPMPFSYAFRVIDMTTTVREPS